MGKKTGLTLFFDSNLVASLAASLGIAPIDVNKAHLSALAWAQNVTT